MTVDKVKLKALAEAATPGPWGSDGSYVCTARTEGGTTYVESWRAVADSNQMENTKFIAEANPAAVLELIAENERLERCEDDLSASVKYWFNACKGAQFEAGVKHADEAAAKYIDEHWRPQRDQLKAENEQLRARLEQIRDRPCSVHGAPDDAMIPNALDAWGRPVPQHLPYDFSGNPGASATQYCNGWNDAGGYWKNHCIDLEQKLAGISSAEKNG
ncbi:MAG: ead/Ea22-like family protein [Gammaproteobacteria bacterium]|uniref:Ead/Ea22-like family protein n=1 Tax=viral metagenome TaxID=1070528 RepID=A0A6M3M142_9ZZZZ|nr:ead/Ea22-like family protein [Gammaproteobacteria bacterium]